MYFFLVALMSSLIGFGLVLLPVPVMRAEWNYPVTHNTTAHRTGTCSPIVQWHPFNISDLRDISWEEYMETVYGEVFETNLGELDLVYKYSAIEIISSDTIKQATKSKHGIQLIYSQSFENSFLDCPAQDYEWLEVTRTSCQCINTQFKHPMNEGLSHGWPIFKSYNRSAPKVPYGCWFYASRGSGVFINVKKTVFIPDREQVPDFFNVSYDTPDRGNDRDWCAHAMAKGYDSIQTVQRISSSANFEVVLCSGACATTEVFSSCPPVPLRTGKNASLPCTCDQSQALINCGSELSPRHCSFAPPPANRPKSCALQKDEQPSRIFNFSVAFTLGIHGRIEELSRWASTLQRLREVEPLLLLDVTMGSKFKDKYGVTALDEALELLRYDVSSVGKHDLKDPSHLPKRIPLLSINLPGFLASAIVHISSIRVGLIGYTVTESLNVTQVSRLIIDEALCLRKRVSVVLLLAHGGFQIDKFIASTTKGYVDAVLTGLQHGSISCAGQWHNHNNGTVTVAVGRHGMQYGLLRIMGSDEGVAISSAVLDIDPSTPRHSRVDSWLATLGATAIPTAVGSS